MLANFQQKLELASTDAAVAAAALTNLHFQKINLSQFPDPSPVHLIGFHPSHQLQLYLWTALMQRLLP
jgi:hypothetical protein